MLLVSSNGSSIAVFSLMIFVCEQMMISRNLWMGFLEDVG
jgi:hypothetical protein